MDEHGTVPSNKLQVLAGQQIGASTAAGATMGTGLTPDTFAEVRERALRTWAIEQAVQMRLHEDEVMAKAREFADYVRASASAAGKGSE